MLQREVIGRLADRILIPSQWSLDLIREAVGIPSGKLTLFRNGIADDPVGLDAIERARNVLGLSGRVPVLASVAMLRREKDHETFLRAVALLKDPYPRVLALVIGGVAGARDYPEGYLERMADELGIAENVCFLGRRTDARTIVAAADIGVSHSLGENLPLAVLEYMAAAKPIVATRAGGTPELIRDGVEGLLVDVGDHGALAERIVTLVEDPEAASRLASRAYQRQQKHFSRRAASSTLRCLYEELIRGDPPLPVDTRQAAHDRPPDPRAAAAGGA
jgi:glycosyltransferase involved in cell wall biosynthesis